MDHNIFFDHSSTTPLDNRALEAMMPYLTAEYGNPSSHMHSLGRSALKAINGAREQVARLLGSLPGEIIFTSGATEANNMAVKGVALKHMKKGGHILISAVEHYSVVNCALRLRDWGFKVETVPVEKESGLINLSALKEKIRPDTLMVALMHANSEIGTIQPVKEAVEIVKSINPGIHFHSDAAASGGLVPLNVKEMGVDSLVLSAHNFYGPKGVGALYLKEGTDLIPLFDGGFQEGGRRSGTENVAGIVGMGKASELALTEMESRSAHLLHLQNRLWRGLEEKVKYLHFTGHKIKRLPGHVSFWVEFAEGESLLLMLTVKKILAASGSACSSNMLAKDEDELIHSNVLEAVGVPRDICSGSITFFMGKENTEKEVDYVLETFPGIVEKLWAMSPSYADMIKAKASI